MYLDIIYEIEKYFCTSKQYNINSNFFRGKAILSIVYTNKCGKKTKQINKKKIRNHLLNQSGHLLFFKVSLYDIIFVCVWYHSTLSLD